MVIIEGCTLLNRYNVLRKIAQGGMGELWLANDYVLTRQVVLKVLRADLFQDNELKSRLRAEAINNGKLSHVNIVSVYDYQEVDNLAFIVMEYIEGDILGNILSKTPILPLAQTLKIMKQIASALAFAHQQGIIHRDIKPDNIIIDKNGIVKVMDFGISSSACGTSLTQTGKVVGTVQYISPEQAHGEAATAKSDIYSLGILAFEMTQAMRPFTGKSIVDIAVAHIKEPLPPFVNIIDPDLINLIKTMLEKDPNKRPIDANEVENVLNKIIEKQSLIGKDITQEPAKVSNVNPSNISYPKNLQFNDDLSKTKIPQSGIAKARSVVAKKEIAPQNTLPRSTDYRPNPYLNSTVSRVNLHTINGDINQRENSFSIRFRKRKIIKMLMNKKLLSLGNIFVSALFIILFIISMYF